MKLLYDNDSSIVNVLFYLHCFPSGVRSDSNDWTEVVKTGLTFERRDKIESRI